MTFTKALKKKREPQDGLLVKTNPIYLPPYWAPHRRRRHGSFRSDKVSAGALVAVFDIVKEKKIIVIRILYNRKFGWLVCLYTYIS